MDKIVVAFDLYGTLLSTASIAEQLATHFGKQKAESIAKVWRTYQLEYTWRLSSMGKYEDFSEITRKSLDHAVTEHGESLDPKTTDSVMEAYDSLSTFPDVGPALRQLASNSKVECVVFSNGTEQMVSNSIQRSPDLGRHSSLFKQIVTVDSVRDFKPSPKVYDHLAQIVGMQDKMGSMWLVSGNPFDIVGARTVGMRAAWVDRAGNGWQDRLGDRPTVVVNNLAAVTDAVQDHVRHSKRLISN